MARPKRTPEEAIAIEEWLKNNKVTICEANARSEDIQINRGWGRRKKVVKAKGE